MKRCNPVNELTWADEHVASGRFTLSAQAPQWSWNGFEAFSAFLAAVMEACNARGTGTATLVVQVDPDKQMVWKNTHVLALHASMTNLFRSNPYAKFGLTALIPHEEGRPGPITVTISRRA